MAKPLGDGIMKATGLDYAVMVPDRALLARPSDHPTELMTIRGARLAIMEELPELGHLNVKRLKTVCGTVLLLFVAALGAMGSAIISGLLGAGVASVVAPWSTGVWRSEGAIGSFGDV